MQSDVSYRLVVRRGPQPNQPYPLTRDILTIGRDITNDIVINDPEVSRNHARLKRTPNGYSIEDLSSTNGTFINRQQLTREYQLTDGDMIGLGETVTLAFEVMGGASSATVVGSGSSQPSAAPPPQYQQPPPVAQPQPSVAPPAAYSPPAPPPPAADDYEDEGPDRNRLLLIGCAALLVALCCAIVIAVIIIDSNCLYCEPPIRGITQMFFECPFACSP